MKTPAKSLLTIGLISIFATSCSSKKQSCDAYGAISKAEKTSSKMVIATNNEMILEKNS